MNDLPEPIPAATLILMRPGVDAPELLMVERAGHMAFAAGAMVFPGGRIDPADHQAVSALSDAPEDAPARIAAIRETIEETGLCPGLAPEPTPSQAVRLREAISHRSLAMVIAEESLSFDLEALTPFARWCPNFRETRRFDTLFYLAEAPSDAIDATPDRTEGVRIIWASAASVLADADAGHSAIIFPTRRNLERLARFASIEEARADAARHPVRRITPWVEERGGGKWVCIPEGIGYPVTAERFETARRR